MWRIFSIKTDNRYEFLFNLWEIKRDKKEKANAKYKKQWIWNKTIV